MLPGKNLARKNGEQLGWTRFSVLNGVHQPPKRMKSTGRTRQGGKKKGGQLNGTD